MYNYKFFFRSILVFIFLLLIISPGCTFSTKANYREFGRQGFDELKQIKDVPEKYLYDLDISSKSYTDKVTELYSIIEEHAIKANHSFSKMKDHATTNDEKELASCLVKYTYYSGLSIPKLRDFFIYLSKNNVSYEDLYLDSELRILRRDIESYENSANLELEKAKEILGRMPEYQKDFSYLYELGEPGKEPQTYYQDSKLDTIIPIFFSFIFLFLIVAFPPLLAYYLWKIYKMRKKDKKIIIQNKLTINPDKKESSFEYLKSFDKLTEKEIVAFLYFRNNPETTKDKLNEMFGDETSSLLPSGHKEENVDQK